MSEYRVEYSERAIRELKKLDKYTRKMIFSWIEKMLVNCKNPESYGKALTNDRKGQWRYRIGDYRLICLIENDRLIITALSTVHRREVYDR